MGMGRHDNYAVALLRQIDIVDITAPASDETGILEPGNRLADTEFFHGIPSTIWCDRGTESLHLQPETYSPAGRVILTIARNENGGDWFWLNRWTPPIGYQAA
jgi:hypothetical protein